MKKKLGFTLVELLAVIVVLAIILAVAMPAITNIISDSTKGAFKSDAKMVLKAIEYKQLENENFNPLTITKENMQTILGISSDNYEQVNISVIDGKIKVILVGKNKWANFTAYGFIRNMRVVKSEDYDEVPPSITIVGDNPKEVGAGTEYTDEGATATDIKDGPVSISSTVIRNASQQIVESINTAQTGTYTITYTAADSQGNTASSIRTVNIVDLTPPVITLIGNSSITIDLGSVYSDEGATALDDFNGDITGDIVTTGTVNPNLVGTYTITYNVSDSSGNAATPVTRTVTVVTEFSDSEGVNKPRLATGMTAIKWTGADWVTVSDPGTDTSWYNYANKEWANAKTADGSMWVWIPRYAYQIATNYHTNTAGTINVKFLKNTTNTASDNSMVATSPTYSGNSQTNFIKHPTFKFGNTELTGIWVAKFEASGTTASLNFVPNPSALHSLTITNMFTATRNIETNSKYGWGTSGNGIDTHMMKNTEWGAAAYLSKSIFGKNAEITINSNGMYYTGGGAYATNVGQSTTGNIYGIYDMSGGVYEAVAAYVNNGHTNLTTNGASIISADPKYKDVYTVGSTDDKANNYALTIDKKGDAVYETSSSGLTDPSAWFSDGTRMPNTTDPWFVRGGKDNYTTYAGPFMFDTYRGDINSGCGFRSVILVGSGL